MQSSSRKKLGLRPEQGRMPGTVHGLTHSPTAAVIASRMASTWAGRAWPGVRKDAHQLRGSPCGLEVVEFQPFDALWTFLRKTIQE